MLAGNVPSHRRQALEGLALVVETALGVDRHPVITVAPLAQYHRTRREIELTLAGTQLNFGMLRADGFQPLLCLGGEAAEGFLLQLVGNAGLDVRAIRIIWAAGKVAIPDRPKFGHGHLAQVGNLPGHGLLLGQRVVHHNFSS